MRIWGVNFRSPAALNKAATTALNKDKAVGVHKVGTPPNQELPFIFSLPGEAFLLTVGAFLLTVKLLCLQSLMALIRRTFPL